MRDALAHADQAVAAAVRRGGVRARPSLTISKTRSPRSRSRTTGRDRPRVLAGVGQGLLHDPVGNQIDAGGRCGRSPLHVNSTGCPRCAASATSRRGPGEPGLGRVRETSSSRRTSEQAAHLGHRLPAGCLAPRRCARGRGRDRCRFAARLLPPARRRSMTLWATTSWSSRAIRCRSSATASRARSPDSARASSTCWARRRTIQPGGPGANREEGEDRVVRRPRAGPRAG